MITGISNAVPLTEKMGIVNEVTEVKGFEGALQKAQDNQNQEELREACKQVEHYMLTSIMKQMKKSIEIGEPLIPKGDYEEMFEDQLVEAQCQEFVEAGGIGLAEMMYQQMTLVKK